MGADQRGPLGVEGGELFGRFHLLVDGVGWFFWRDGWLGWEQGRWLGCHQRAVLEPVAGALHGGGAEGILGLAALGLEAEQVAEAALGVAIHPGGLVAVVVEGVDGEVGAGGVLEGVLGVEVLGDDLGGEFGLEGVFRDEGGDGGHGAVVARGACFGRVGGGGWQVPAEVGVDLAGEAVWDVGDWIHGVPGLLLRAKGAGWCYVGYIQELVLTTNVDGGQVSDRGSIVGCALRVVREVRIVADQRKEARTQS